MTVGFVSALVFGLWAFSGKQANETNLEKRIADASTVAVQEAVSAKETEFEDKLKEPFRTYVGNPTYGALMFEYSKTWSVYAVEDEQRTLLDFYAQPYVVPGLGKEINFAFRAQILNTPYDEVVTALDRSVTEGKITADPYRPEKVSSELGVYVTGEVVAGKQGVMVLLPQRDKTFKLWTESKEHIDDFNTLVRTLSYDP